MNHRQERNQLLDITAAAVIVLIPMAFITGFLLGRINATNKLQERINLLETEIGKCILRLPDGMEMVDPPARSYPDYPIEAIKWYA